MRISRVLILLVLFPLMLLLAGPLPVAAVCTSPCVSVSASPTSLTIPTGSSATSTVLDSTSIFFPFGGCATLNLSTDVSPAGPTATLDHYTDCLNSFSAPASHVLTVDATGTSAGTYTVTVTVCAPNGSNPCYFSNSATVTVNVLDFSLSADPNALTIDVGSSATSTITVAGKNGFTGQIGLSASSSPGVTPSVVPASLSLDASTTSATATLSVTSPSVGSYSVFVASTSGSLSHTIEVSVKVVDYSIVASPSLISLLQGSSQPSTISVAPQNGFPGTVTLSASSPSGLGTQFSTNSITASTTSVLTISATASITPGTYTVSITGASGPLSHTTTVTVNVGAAPSFSIDASPSSLSLKPGLSGSSMIQLASLNGFTGTVTLTYTINPTGPTVNLPQSTVPLSPGGSGSSTLSVVASSAGTFTLTLTGTSGAIIETKTLIVNVLDFSIVVSPSSMNVNSGSSATSALAINSLNGFADQVNLGTSVAPTGPTCTLTPANVIGSGTAALTCNSTNAVTFVVTISGTSGGLSHLATVTINVQDFGISASPTTLSLNAGVAGTSAISVSSVNGFSGKVSLSVAVSPAVPTASLSPTSLTLTAGASGTSSLSIGGVTTNHVVSITATSGSLVRTLTISANLIDTTKPQVTITSPSDGSVVSVLTVRISGNASDDVAVQKVEVSMDGANWMMARGTTSWSTDLTLKEGSNTVYARATDTSGNAQTTTIMLTVRQQGAFLSSNLIWIVPAVMVAGFVAAVQIARRKKQRVG